ncbi:MAG: hypothetical protein ACPG7F_09145 [Aggregatilineales bacterium]
MLKKYLRLIVLFLLLSNLLMLSPVCSVLAQDEDTAAETEVPENTDAEDTTESSDSDDDGFNPAMIGALVAVFAGAGIAIFSAQQAVNQQKDDSDSAA